MAKPTAAAGTVFYIAPTGNDAWSGTLSEPNPSHNDGPLATLDKARQLVRPRIAKGLTSPVTVQIRGGAYQLDTTVVFGPEDSGTEECPVTYAAYPGEKPVFTGAKRLSNWTKCTHAPDGLPKEVSRKVVLLQHSFRSQRFMEDYLSLRWTNNVA